jgi:hypothetical protein
MPVPRTTKPRTVARAPAPEARTPAVARRRIRRSTNSWWCPDDDRAMQIKDPPIPCDVCGKVPSDFS